MPSTIGRLKTRPEFLRVARGGRKWVVPGLVLQARPRQEGPRRGDTPADSEARDDSATDAIRFGLTASRKVGGAVVRNRARRRLRAAAQTILPATGRAGFDYVLIARAGTPRRPYAALLEDLRVAVERVGKQKPRTAADTRSPGTARGRRRR